MVLILAPVEEITKVILKQTVILSMVIPMIRVLLRSWEKEDDDRGVQTMKNEMVKGVKSRLAGIEVKYLLFYRFFLLTYCMEDHCKRSSTRRIKEGFRS